MGNSFDSNLITALATGLLVVVGWMQIRILRTQRRHDQLSLLEEYQHRWYEYKKEWGALIFFTRDEDEYYQIANIDEIEKLQSIVGSSSLSTPTIPALNAVRTTCSLLNDICMKVLQDQLNIRDIYPIFGSQFLRQSKPLRRVLDVYYGYDHNRFESDKHKRIRTEIQDWLIYHDGVRRRCLIFIDLLWAEAVRLEDLTPEDIKNGANAKIKTGKKNRNRLFKEAIRLNGYNYVFTALKLSRFLLYSEYRSILNIHGIDKQKLKLLENEWTNRILRK